MFVFGSIKVLLKITDIDLSYDNRSILDDLNQRIQSEAVVFLLAHHDKADIPRILIALAEHLRHVRRVVVPVSYFGYKHPFIKREIIDRFYPEVTNHLDASQMATAFDTPHADNPYGVEVYSAWREFEETRYQIGELSQADRKEGLDLFKLYVKRTQPIFRNPHKYPGTIIVLAPSARMTRKGQHPIDALYSKLTNNISLYCMSLEWTPRLTSSLSKIFLAQVRLYPRRLCLNEPATYHNTADWQPADAISLERANAEIDGIYKQIERWDQGQLRQLLVQLGAISLNPEQLIRDFRERLRLRL